MDSVNPPKAGKSCARSQAEVFYSDRVRAFLTGGTGFIGARVAGVLRDRGDEVVALARSASRATALHEAGCALVEGDLTSVDTLSRAMAGCDAVLHLAGMYEVGIPASEHAAMREANVLGTERVLDAAVAAGIGRIAYVSTVNVFGNTRGVVVDETYRRPSNEFVSYYDRTKYEAHLAAEERIEAGAPIVIAMPGGVYGPGDHSDVGTLIDQVRSGKLKVRTFPEMGMNLGHVDDIAAGIVRIHDRGRLGESYVIGGEIARLGDLLDLVARITGRRAPRFTMPVGVMKAFIPFGPLVGKAMGLGPNLREIITAASGVTYWATDAKARNDLGYEARDLETGIRQTLGVA
jgi:nucleoside-diphosphate-sugar epimerase